MGSRREPKGGRAQRVGTRRVEGPKCLVFPISAANFVLPSLSGVLLVEWWPLFEAVAHGSNRGHNPTKRPPHSDETTKFAAENGEKSEMLGGPAKGGPAEGGPTEEEFSGKGYRRQKITLHKKHTKKTKNRLHAKRTVSNRRSVARKKKNTTRPEALAAIRSQMSASHFISSTSTGSLTSSGPMTHCGPNFCHFCPRKCESFVRVDPMGYRRA